MNTDDDSARLDEHPHQTAMSMAEHEVEALLDAAVDAVVVIDEHGHILQFSLAARQIFGYTLDEVVGRNVRMLMPEPYKAEHDGYMERYMRTGEQRIIGTGREVSARRKDGTVFPCDLAVGRVRGIEPPHFVGFIRDISERRRAEDETRQMRERLTHFSRLSTMGEMAAGLAHEINQPLSAIATYAQACQRMLAADGSASDDVRNALLQINLQALRAGDVIRSLRNFVKNREVKREPTDCRRLLDDMRLLADTDARMHETNLQIQLADDLPAVHVDPVQLQQVVLNLVRNAIDAVSTLPRSDRRIEVKATLNAEGDVEISVADRGPGLSPDVLEQLFLPFFTTKSGGTGLGLAISRSIVRAHGGLLWHSTNDYGGATFHFTLPVVPP